MIDNVLAESLNAASKMELTRTIGFLGDEISVEYGDLQAGEGSQIGASTKRSGDQALHLVDLFCALTGEAESKRYLGWLCRLVPH